MTDASSARPDALPRATRALLLDMDGTLLDSGPCVERSWNHLLEELGSPRHFEAAMHGRPALQVLREVFPDMSETELHTAHQRIEEIEIADAEGLRIMPGAERLLSELDAAATTLGAPTWTIVTSCTRPLFTARWSQTGLPTPEHLVTADQVSAGKPDPEPFRTGAQRLGHAPAQTIALEDSTGGLRSARAAGCTAIALTTTTPAEVLRPLCDALATSLDDLEVHVRDGEMILARRTS